MLVTFDRDGRAVRAGAEDAACIGSMALERIDGHYGQVWVRYWQEKGFWAAAD